MWYNFLLLVVVGRKRFFRIFFFFFIPNSKTSAICFVKMSIFPRSNANALTFPGSNEYIPTIYAKSCPDYYWKVSEKC